MAPQSWVGNTIGGRYRIEALLGQGGMSAVYRAYDPNLRRVVAIKLIHTHLSSDPNFIGRFKEEASAIARLRHPNIVQVHDFDIDGETYYMVMEYLVGETLQARLKRLSATGRYLPFAEAVRICTQISEAAGCAHDHELVHRDIKPANIILDVNGNAILMDFGIVKIVGGEYHTATGATIGTAMYMSPEQIRGERVDDRSDIYSLGVTLYEMISGRPPYQADSAMSLMMMVLNDPLPDIRKFREDIPDDLAAVVSRAMAKEHAQRYPSMAEMRAALLEVRETLTSKPPPITVVEGEAGTLAEVESSRPTSTSTFVEGNSPFAAKAPPFTGSEGESSGESQPSQEPGSMPAPPGRKQLQESAAPPARAIQPERKPTRPGSRRILYTAVVTVPLLFAAVFYIFSSNREPPLQLTPFSSPSAAITAQTAQGVVSLGTWDIDSIAADLAFSPDGKLLATASSREWMRISKYRFYAGLWQVETGNRRAYLLGHSYLVSGVAFSPDGQYIASGSDDGSLILWQVQNGSLVRRMDAQIGGMTGVDFSPNNMLLAAGSWDGKVGLWQVSNGNLLRTLQESEDGILDIEFSPDGSLIAAGSYDDTIKIWKVSDGSLVRILRGHLGAVVEVAFSPDGTLLASASEDHTSKLWQVGNGNQVMSLEGHVDTVKDVAFSPDGSLLASVSDDSTLRFWQVDSGQKLSTLNEEDSILSLSFSPDGRYLVTSAGNHLLHFWGISEAIPFELTPAPASP